MTTRSLASYAKSLAFRVATPAAIVLGMLYGLVVAGGFDWKWVPGFLVGVYASIRLACSLAWLVAMSAERGPMGSGILAGIILAAATAFTCTALATLVAFRLSPFPLSFSQASLIAAIGGRSVVILGLIPIVLVGGYFGLSVERKSWRDEPPK